MLRKHAKKLRLETNTIRVLTLLQTTLVRGGFIPPSVEPCPKESNLGCLNTDGC